MLWIMNVDVILAGCVGLFIFFKYFMLPFGFSIWQKLVYDTSETLDWTYKKWCRKWSLMWNIVPCLYRKWKVFQLKWNERQNRKYKSSSIIQCLIEGKFMAVSYIEFMSELCLWVAVIYVNYKNIDVIYINYITAGFPVRYKSSVIPSLHLQKSNVINENR